MSPGRVRAARLVAPGSPLAIERLDLPEPAGADVRVELAFAGVNPFDRLNARGLVGTEGPLPRTIGGEGAGFAAGRPVLVAGGPAGMGLTRDGTWASAANVPESAVVPLPAGADLCAAATIGVAGQTAWQTVRSVGRVAADDRVLVLGAAGGVGGMAVALAADAGAEVWGQTTRPERADAIRAAGASHVVVGGPEALAKLRPTVALDGLGGAFTGALVACLEPRGRLVSYGTAAGAEARVDMQLIYRKALSVQGYASMRFDPAQRDAALHGALGALASGVLRVHVDEVLPLGAADDALDRLASRRVVGKLVLDLRG